MAAVSMIVPWIARCSSALLAHTWKRASSQPAVAHPQASALAARAWPLGAWHGSWSHLHQGTAQHQQQEQHVGEVYVVPLPKLSPTMTRGKIVRWFKQPGERINLYDVLFEVSTDELTEEVFKVGDFAGTVNLLVEAHEEGWLAAIWHPADDARDLQAGTPVGLVCEEEGQVAEVARAYRCPTTDVYDAAQPSVPVLTWQSHLAKGTRKVKCMG